MNYIIKRGEFYVKDWRRYPGRSQWIWTLGREKAMTFSEEEIRGNRDLPPLPQNYELIEIE
jgi:hypothetical protein